MVLQCTGHNLRRGGGSLVHQDHHGCTIKHIIRRGIETQAGVRNTSLGINDQPLGQEGIRDGDGAIEHTTRVVPEIQYQAIQGAATFLFELGDRVVKVIGGLGLKLRNTQVAQTGFKHPALDALDLDDVAGDRYLQRPVHSFTDNRENNIGPGLATHDLDCVVQRHALDRCVIQTDYQIARLDTRTLRRRIVNRCNDLDESILHTDLDTQTAKLTGCSDLEFLELVNVKIGRMGVETGQHAADGIFQQFLVFYRFDIVVLDASEHITEGTQLLYRQCCPGGFTLGKNAMTDRDQHTQHQAGQQQQIILCFYFHTRVPSGGYVTVAKRPVA